MLHQLVLKISLNLYFQMLGIFEILMKKTNWDILFINLLGQEKL